MNTQYTYSIAIISKDRRILLENCLEKLHQQDFPADIVCVEATDAAEPKYAEDITYVRLPAHEAGFSKQRNIAIDHAKGDYVIFVDDDCEITPDWFKHLVDPVETNASLLGTLGAVFPLNPTIIGFCEGVLGHPSGGFKLHARSEGKWLPLSQVSTCNSIVQKQAMKSAGKFDLKNVFGSEDTDLLLRITEKFGKNRFRYSPHALCYHQPRNSLKKIIPWYIRRGKSDAALFLKHMTHWGYLLKTSIFIKALPVIFLAVWLKSFAFAAVAFLGWYVLQLYRNRFMWRYFQYYDFSVIKRLATFVCFPSIKFIADCMFDAGRIIGIFKIR